MCLECGSRSGGTKNGAILGRGYLVGMDLYTFALVLRKAASGGDETRREHSTTSGVTFPCGRDRVCVVLLCGWLNVPEYQRKPRDRCSPSSSEKRYRGSGEASRPAAITSVASI